VTDDKYADLVADNEKRMKALHPLTVDLTPPRIQHLTDQVFELTYATLEEWEMAWQEKVAQILSEVEPQVAQAKLMAGNKQHSGQLTLV